jgi:hypothetical protein
MDTVAPSALRKMARVSAGTSFGGVLNLNSCCLPALPLARPSHKMLLPSAVNSVQCNSTAICSQNRQRFHPFTGTNVLARGKKRKSKLFGIIGCNIILVSKHKRHNVEVCTSHYCDSDVTAAISSVSTPASTTFGEQCRRNHFRGAMPPPQSTAKSRAILQ